MRWIVGCVLCLLAVGCAYANPRTELSAGPFGSYFSFHDSKDNEIVMEGLSYDPDTNFITVQKFEVRNNASDVRVANVEQMKAHTEQIKAFSAIVRDLASIVSAVTTRPVP